MIPKFPDVPPLTNQQVKRLTEMVFLDENELICKNKKCDLLFVFGGTHPGSWQTAFQLYQSNIVDKIVLTGGIKLGAMHHPSWKFGDRPESHVMRENLVKLGVPDHAMIVEDQSTDSLENLQFTKQLIDYSKIKKLAFICKNYAAGRQFRTLQKHLPSTITLFPYPFDTSPWEGRVITRHNWMNISDSRSLVYGEYLRIVHYGEKGDITPITETIFGL
jgi:uncharacterized SAM-binding protein YcdF (DUF218 family)